MAEEQVHCSEESEVGKREREKERGWCCSIKEHSSEACKVLRLNPKGLAPLPEGELFNLALLQNKPLIVPSNSRV